MILKMSDMRENIGQLGFKIKKQRNQIIAMHFINVKKLNKVF